MDKKVKAGTILRLKKRTVVLNSKNTFFCAAPWTSLCLYPTGNVTPCCIFKNSNFLEVGNLNKMSVEMAFNSPLMVSVRQEMLSGHIPTGCLACHLLEKAGGDSYRKKINRQYLQDANLASCDSKSGEIAKPEFQFFDLAFTNSCNLRCRMCNDEFCNGLAEEIAIINNFENHKSTATKEVEIPEEYLNKNKFKMLKLQGGEPLTSPRLISILKKLIKSGRAKDISLQINTNATLLSENIFSIFSQFKQCWLRLSIDAWGKRNSYIRYPSKWSDIFDKISIAKHSSKQYENINIEIVTVIQIYNILYMPEIYRNFKFYFGVEIHFQLLYEPIYFSIQSLPKDFKKNVHDKFTQVISSSNDTYLINELQIVLNHMTEKDCSENMDRFIEVTKIFDKTREQQISDYCPEFHSLFTTKVNSNPLLPKI